MAIPSDPTVTSIVRDALRHAGLFQPTTAQITELSTEGLQTVKTELWLSQERDRLLETAAMVLLPIGSGQLNTPADFNHVVTIDVYGATSSMAFTAAAGASGTMTAPSTFGSDATFLRGQYLFTTGGTGSGQYRQITDYNDTTKVLSITPNWTTPPDATTTAFVGHLRKRLVMDDQDPGRLLGNPEQTQGFPTRYRQVGSSPLNTDNPAIEIIPVPDTANYAALLTYGTNLTRLDETGTLFVKHLRERRTIWIQGLIDQACRRYDEARYPAEFPRWAMTLSRYAAHNPTYDRVEVQR